MTYTIKDAWEENVKRTSKAHLMHNGLTTALAWLSRQKILPPELLNIDWKLFMQVLEQTVDLTIEKQEISVPESTVENMVAVDLVWQVFKENPRFILYVASGKEPDCALW